MSERISIFFHIFHKNFLFWNKHWSSIVLRKTLPFGKQYISQILFNDIAYKNNVPLIQ